MNVCPDCGMGPRGIESEGGTDACQNCGYTEEFTGSMSNRTVDDE